MKNYAAVDIGGTSIKYGIVDENGTVVFHSKMPTEAEKGVEHYVQNVTAQIALLIGKYPEISGIGISTAGVVDSSTGCVVHAADNLPGYAGTSWNHILSESFHLPVSVCNDVNAAALAEAWVGAARGCDNFLCVAIGTGIGGAAFVNGRLYTGAHYSAAEIGYMTTAGNETAYENKASTIALVKNIISATGDSDVDGINAFSRARSGNAIYAKSLDKWFDELAKGIANTVLCFDPELLIIGGAVSNEGEPFLQRIHESLKKYIPEDFLNSLIIKTAGSGNHAGMIGSVYSFINSQK